MMLAVSKQRNCPKHVDFHSKNKFEKLVHLLGFIVQNLSRCAVTWTSKKSNFNVQFSGLRCFVVLYTSTNILGDCTATFCYSKVEASSIESLIHI
jgi:hypothetical protein